MKARGLFAIPVLTYAASYVYLAVYHGRAWLWDTVIHEGGVYTLFETTFYASHFLGHVPVHTALALVFVGWHRMLSLESDPRRRAVSRTAVQAIGLMLFLVASYFLSLELFGSEDTHDYICQRKQSVVRLERGGSWKLHLPSTLSMLVIIPASILVMRSMCRAGADLRRRGAWAVLAGVAVILGYTLWFTSRPQDWLAEVFTDPRYVAHSVREIATFPLTYFAPTMALLLAPPSRERGWFAFEGRARPFAAFMLVATLAGCAYQCWVPLSAGSIGEIAQKPDFAHGDGLGVPYLLASHYFEHFLDTIYFVGLCVILNGVIATRRPTSDGTR